MFESCGLHLDDDPEVVQSLEQAFGEALFVLSREVLRAEVLVDDAVAQHEVRRGEHGAGARRQLDLPAKIVDAAQASAGDTPTPVALPPCPHCGGAMVAVERLTAGQIAVQAFIDGLALDSS